MFAVENKKWLWVINLIAIHTTDTKNVSSIIKKGIKCKSYPEHPIARNFDCASFFYPIDGVDEQLKFWPKNARMKGMKVDDGSYIIADIGNCVVGDLYLEDRPDEYKSKTMSFSNYVKEANYSRSKFREPEITCSDEVPPKKILGSLLYSELNKINNECMKLDKDVYNCIETNIKKILEK